MVNGTENGLMVKGAENGLWSAMATTSAGPLYWAADVRLAWRWSKIKARFGRKPNKLIRLSMIGFARWSMFYRVQASVPHRLPTPLRRPFLLFETNFNGDSDQYLESFSLIIPSAMNRIWAKAYGVPDVRRVSEWQQYVNKKKLPIAFYYSAYPKASTKTIRSALELERMLPEFRTRTEGVTGAGFEREFRALLARVQRIRNPKRNTNGKTTCSLSTLVPVLEGHRQQLEMDLETLMQSPAAVPPGTHFARWCVVDHLEMPKRFGQDNTSFLLFSAWFDGRARDKKDPDAPLRHYAAALHEQLGARAHHIWRHCGFRDGDAAAFAERLLGHAIEPGVSFAGYSGVTVGEVRAALKLWGRFHEFARESQLRAVRDRALQAAWEGDPLLSRGT
jgi:hypothetical protein